MNQNHLCRRAILFFVSQCITLLGSQIVQMAIVWHVTLQTASGAWVAAFSVFSYLPQFFVSFAGGALADRYPRKFLIVSADLFIAAATLVMLLIMPRISSNAALLLSLLIMSIVRSAAAGIQTPAVSAAIAQLVLEDQLMRYNGIHAAMQSLVQFTAPALAAVVLTISTLRAALLMDIVTAALGVSLLCFVPFPTMKNRKRDFSLLEDAGSSVRYAYSFFPVRNLLAIYALFIFLTVPAGYLSGLLVSRLFGDTYWHLTATELSGFGGMTAGGILMSLWSGFKQHRKTLAAGLSLFGAMAACMGLARHFPAYLIFMALYGVALTVVQTTITTLLQRHAESSMHGRVFGLMSSLYACFYPLGMALFGPLGDTVPLQLIMILSGAALLLLAGMAYGDTHLEP